jgi:hypothetical protein
MAQRAGNRAKEKVGPLLRNDFSLFVADTKRRGREEGLPTARGFVGGWRSWWLSGS